MAKRKRRGLFHIYSGAPKPQIERDFSPGMTKSYYEPIIDYYHAKEAYDTRPGKPKTKPEDINLPIEPSDKVKKKRLSR